MVDLSILGLDNETHTNLPFRPYISIMLLLIKCI